MTIIAVCGSKGGVGKTTLAVHLATWPAGVGDGQPVVLIDCDANRSAERWLAEAAPDVAVERASSADELLEGVPELARAHHVVIDCAGGSDELTRAAMLVADAVVLPTGPGVLDLRALTLTVRLLKQAQSIRDHAPDAAIVMTRVRRGTRLAAEAVLAIDALGVLRVGAVIHERIIVSDLAGQQLLAWNAHGQAAAEVRADLEGVFGELAERWGEGGAVFVDLADDEDDDDEPYTGFDFEGNAREAGDA